MFVVRISTENAAFYGDNETTELVRLLRAMADKLEAGADSAIPMHLMDVNGHVVGKATVEQPRPDEKFPWMDAS